MRKPEGNRNMKKNNKECGGFSIKKMLAGILILGILAAAGMSVYKKVQQQQVAALKDFVTRADLEVQNYIQKNGVVSKEEQSLLTKLSSDLTKIGTMRGKALQANSGRWKAYIRQDETGTSLFVESNIDGINFIHIKYRPYSQIEYNCQYLSAVDNGKKFCEQFAAGDKKWIFNFLDDYAY